jgi:hypothetical protein
MLICLPLPPPRRGTFLLSMLLHTNKDCPSGCDVKLYKQKSPSPPLEGVGGGGFLDTIKIVLLVVTQNPIIKEPLFHLKKNLCSLWGIDRFLVSLPVWRIKI